MAVDLKGVFGKMWEMADAYHHNTGHTIQKDGMAWLMNKMTWELFCVSKDCLSASYIKPEMQTFMSCYVILSADVPGKEVFLVIGSSNKWLQHPSSHPKTPKPKWKSSVGVPADNLTYVGGSGNLNWNFMPSSGTLIAGHGGGMSTSNSTISVSSSSSTTYYHVYDSSGTLNAAFTSLELAKSQAFNLGGCVYLSGGGGGGPVWESKNWELIQMLGGPSAIKVGINHMGHNGKGYVAHKHTTGAITVTENVVKLPFDVENPPLWWKLNSAGNIETVKTPQGTVEGPPSNLLLALQSMATKSIEVIELNGYKYKVYKGASGALEVHFYGPVFKAPSAPSVGPASAIPDGYTNIKPKGDFSKPLGPGVYSEGQLDNVLASFKKVEHEHNPLLDTAIWTINGKKVSIAEAVKQKKEEIANALGEDGEDIMEDEEEEPPKVMINKSSMASLIPPFTEEQKKQLKKEINTSWLMPGDISYEFSDSQGLFQQQDNKKDNG